MSQQAAYRKQGLWPTQGNASPDSFIENLFQTWLYTGNDSTQTINNGIDLAGKGGMVWLKRRSSARNNYLFDTTRGVTNWLVSNQTSAQETVSDTLTAFNSDGFSLGNSINTSGSGNTYASWTFREQPKFFDVVTFTGNSANRTIAHNLGSTPGCIIVKCTSTTGQWVIWHRSGTQLNNFAAYFTTGGYVDQGASIWGTSGGVPSMNSTTFSLGTDGDVNTSGATYVAYLFAHDSGGFGLTGTDNVISCGTYNGTGAVGQVATLGYEPQWVLIKATNTVTGWYLWDTMRGMPVGVDGGARLFPNTSDAETIVGPANGVFPTATGFGVGGGATGLNQSGGTYIYIAIRRGPMAVPTTGTSVFDPESSSATTGTKITTNFPVDLQIWSLRGEASSRRVVDRLRGVSSNTTTSGVALLTDTTDAENPASSSTRYWDNTGFTIPDTFVSGLSTIYWNFRRAPSVFDEVCYTGTGVARTLAHNLTVVPEMMICKARTTGVAGPYNWTVYHTALSAGGFAYLNLTNAGVFSGNTSFWNGTAPTASVFSLGGASGINQSGLTFVNYLFATCPGVSKVGSYTGTGTTQTINCGFTAGARFVLIKRTDSTGDWFVWDSARGIVAGNDPYITLNTQDAEVTNTDFVDTAATGFEISSTAPAAINANGGTFIFLAIA